MGSEGQEEGAMAHVGGDWEKARDWLKQESVTKMSAKVKNYFCSRFVLALFIFSGAKSW